MAIFMPEISFHNCLRAREGEAGMLGGDGMSILDNQSVIDDERSAALGYTHSMVGSKAGSGEDSAAGLDNLF